jgi:hypothetical protein
MSAHGLARHGVMVVGAFLHTACGPSPPNWREQGLYGLTDGRSIRKSQSWDGIDERWQVKNLPPTTARDQPSRYAN